jgi:nitrite reductase/ring-hydroxylating ferredoxin subunit
MKTHLGYSLSIIKKLYIQRIIKPKEESFNEVDDLIVGKIGGLWIAYDRVCDHNGGTLNLDPNKKTATCPLHKWPLKLDEGKYENNCSKIMYKANELESHLEVYRFNYEFPDINTEDLLTKKLR